ncbi:MAG: hypothetical protein IKV23_04585 [Bacteroidaceae bacterium]|nr:hypothetical protein [Bacteroidaceae bacterium]
MTNLRENSGILGYGKSKQKKNRDFIMPDVAGGMYRAESGDADSAAPVGIEYADALARSLEPGARYIEQSNNRWEALDAERIGETVRARQLEAFVPRDTPERRRRLFVTSPKVVNEALDDYYSTTFAPNFKAQRSQADERAINAYRDYVVPGAEPLAALGAMRRETNPARIIGNTMTMDDDGKLDAIAERYAGYAGLNPQDYRRSVLEPALRERATDELIKERTPKSSAEYVGRQAWRSSLPGALSEMALQGYSGTHSHRFLDDAAMDNYGASRLEDWTAGVGGLLLDSGVFAGLGSAASSATGAATNFIKNRAVARIMARGAASGMTRKAAEQTVRNAMVNSLGAKIVQSSFNQGLTLGAYDAAHSVVNDILHNEEINAGAAADAFGRGATTGAALGVVGTPLKAISRGLTGGKKLAASAGVLTAESAVFTGMAEAGKLAQGIEVEPIDLLYDFGESAATLLAMRMFHWQPSGAGNKLNSVGRLKSQLRFSLPESEEMARAGVDAEAFITKLEKSLNVYRTGNSERTDDAVRDDYMRLMLSPELSASTRSKLLFLVENKISSTPPAVVDYSIEPLGNDRYNFVTMDAEGRKIESVPCEGEEGIKSALFIHTGSLRRNRIAEHERLLMQSYDSQNFFRQAGKYARETGTDINVIAEAMYAKANGEEVTPEQQQMLGDILRRSNYSDSEVAQMLYNTRRSLEQKYGLHEGSLLEAVNKNFFYCSPNENAALNEYERIMRNEVHSLYDGTSPERAAQLSSGSGRYGGLGNEELKNMERSEFTANAIRTGKGLNEGAIPTLSEKYGIFSSGMREPEGWDQQYVWNTHGNRYTIEEVERMAVEAKEFARKLGVEIDVIRNEREISEYDNDYSNKVRSYGWYDEANDAVVINIPNNANVRELHATIVHEVVGHMGLSKLFGNYYTDFLEELYSRGSREVREGIEQQAKKLGGNHHYGADEYLARLSEKTITTPEERSILQRFRDFVRDMLRRLNIYDAPIGERELMTLIRRHHQAMANRRGVSEYRSEAFVPFKSARYADDGYENLESLKMRYDRMKEEYPRFENIPEPFRYHKLALYGEVEDADAYDAAVSARMRNQYRDIGLVGIENLKNAKIEKFDNRLKKARTWYTDYHRKETAERKTPFRQDTSGRLKIFVGDHIQNARIKDYVLRTLETAEPRLAKKYRKILGKPEGTRSLGEMKFLKGIYRMVDIYDDTAVLGDILADERFFSIYPDAKKLPVVFHPLKNKLSLYDVQNKVIVVDKRGFANSDELKSSLYLALNHVVQDIESFDIAPVDFQHIVENMLVQYYQGRNTSNYLMDAKKDGMRMPEFFKKDYGVEYNEFNTLFPTPESYVRSHIGRNIMQRNQSQHIGYTTDDEQLKSILMGPLDIIESTLAKIRYRGEIGIPRKVATLYDAERMTGRYAYPEDHPYNHPVRPIREIKRDYYRYYGKNPIELPTLKLKR